MAWNDFLANTIIGRTILVIIFFLALFVVFWTWDNRKLVLRIIAAIIVFGMLIGFIIFGP